MSLPAHKRTALVALPLVLILAQLGLVTVSRSAEPAAAMAATQQAGGCPGERMDVQATGVYRSLPVPEAEINGAPWSGAFWEAGMRSYWHCHPGGQLLVVWEGEGRTQKRGERMQTLHRGESSFVGPWEEHWHGSAPDQDAQYLQVSFLPTGTLWMEEVGDPDYLGNEIGMTTRTAFLRTGVREWSAPR